MEMGMPSLQAFDGRLADTATLIMETGSLKDSMKSGARYWLPSLVGPPNRSVSGPPVTSVISHQQMYTEALLLGARSFSASTCT